MVMTTEMVTAKTAKWQPAFWSSDKITCRVFTGLALNFIALCIITVLDNSPLFGVTTAKLYMYIYLYNLLFYQAGAKIDSVCQYHENIQMKGNSIK